MTLLELEVYTTALISRIKTVAPEELEYLIELRESVLASFNSSQLTSDDMQIVRVLQSYDATLLSRMRELKEEAAAALLKIQQSKVQKNAYSSTGALGSYFIDKRN
ncbi:hypothetical protein M3223_22960 [Paenibacillus pasadenensis]|uniref:hypothetical protein n=1 Tax=Paenibacillus pasadenensis TaxID=217090 RepID=UPI00203C4A78|nr:hypothetical protein [Paenibacillus pasadenensis]MCM3750201.1 hypothetical protein [Paenibacillus pasadenensis]